ncbi:MAG: hypothetical protein AAB354_15740, partial [candidate division KSB1 bacterium]
MALSKLTRALHKWLSLFVGLQVLAWVVGGLVMSYFPIEKVRSEHLSNAAPEEMPASLPAILAAR